MTEGGVVSTTVVTTVSTTGGVISVVTGEVVVVLSVVLFVMISSTIGVAIVPLSVVTTGTTVSVAGRVDHPLGVFGSVLGGGVDTGGAVVTGGGRGDPLAVAAIWMRASSCSFVTQVSLPA